MRRLALVMLLGFLMHAPAHGATFVSNISRNMFPSKIYQYFGSDLKGNLGQISGTSREVVASPQNIGHFVFGPYAQWIEGDAKATFQLNLDIVDTNDEDVLTIEIYDFTANEIVASRKISRRDFGGNHVPQDFVLYFSTRRRAGHKMETRVHTRGVSFIAFHKVTIEVDPSNVGLPKILNQSGAPDSHVLKLAQQAVSGLGFGSSASAPNANDILFVGKWYMAWIDQTGFVGKMNGLWQLNGESSARLNFVLQKNGRPLNVFIPGENGDGEWGGTYTGAEHYELPNWTPEEGKSCAGEICGWYAYNEAPWMIPKTPGQSIEWWSACNTVKPGFSKIFSPIGASVTAGGLELWYEDKLVKMADNTLPRNGSDCGLDFLADDGQRRTALLQTGYKLYNNSPIIDRMYRYRNLPENPTFLPRGYIIGGFVITDLNKKIPEKSFYNNFRWTNGLVNESGSNFPAIDYKFPPKEFVPLISGSPKQDTVIGWAQTSYVASVFPRLQPGMSIGMSHPDMGKSQRQEDIGTCVCYVHGGFEMGGGVLSDRTGAVPLEPNSLSISNTRRLWLPTSQTYLPEWQ